MLAQNLDEIGISPDYPAELREQMIKDHENSQQINQQNQVTTPEAEKIEGAPANSNVKFGSLDDLPSQQADGDGFYRFEFHAQPWLVIMEWFSRVSPMSVDWRELPTDKMNLRSRRGYTLDEVRDVLNLHLIKRGFTILQNGDNLSVEKLDDIDLSLVPRVTPAGLAKRLPHDFVRISFPLHNLMAEEAAKELESLKGKYARLTPMPRANRIEVVDVVSNLHEMHSFLESQQLSPEVGLREFVLRHVRATYVVTRLQELLDTERLRGLPMLQQQMRQLQQQRLAQQQQAQQKKPATPPNANVTLPSANVTFTVNQRRNSVIVHGPADKMVVIERTVRLLDVPSAADNSLGSQLSRVQTYRLMTLDPAEVVKILMETDAIDPGTQLRIDEESRAIIASGPPWDHLTIQKLLEKLDGSAREFRVVRLRRRRADEVATTIETLMVGARDEENQQRRVYYYGARNSKDKDRFRVGADVQHNWLLLWCNQTEYRGVMDLLAELGEVSSVANVSNSRVLQMPAGDNQKAFLKRLRAAFQAVAPNPIELPSDLDEPSEPESEDSKIKETRRGPARQGDVPSKENAPSAPAVRYVQATSGQTPLRSPTATENAQPGQSPPPVRMSRGADGGLTITSQDTAALDLLEDLVAEMLRGDKPYEVFRVQHAPATWVAFKLEDFFEMEEDEPRPRRPFVWGNEEPEPKRPGLGDRRKLRFIPDRDTNTIIVRNAVAEQLATIRELIELYDIPEPVNSETARFTEVFQIKYSRASVVSETIKEAFRDLLSGNDKAFQANHANGQSQAERDSGSFMWGFDDDEISIRNSPRATFKGKLSIGVDDSTNSLVVSTEGEKLMQMVRRMIDALDQAAMPTDVVRIVNLRETAHAAGVKEALANMFGKAPTQPTRKQPEQAQNGNPNDRARRGAVAQPQP